MAYGLKIFGPDGLVRLDTDETFTRVVATVKKNFDFSGTVSVPDFDDTKGMFFVSYFINKFRIDTDTALADSFSPLDYYYGHLVIEFTSLPSLVWNNSTKLLTCTPVSWPAGWTRSNKSDYAVTFIHYR